MKIWITLIITCMILISGCQVAVMPDDTISNTNNKDYVSEDTEECKRVNFLCIEGKEPFFDDTGCGCQDKEETGSEKEFCIEEQRNADACIEIYQPVCGWNDPEKIQCIRYPCAQDYSNSCFACSDENVLYYTEGGCPKG